MQEPVLVDESLLHTKIHFYFCKKKKKNQQTKIINVEVGYAVEVPHQLLGIFIQTAYPAVFSNMTSLLLIIYNIC